MGYGSFDIQVQCEEYRDWLFPVETADPESEDILDRCEVVSLHGLDEVACGTYEMDGLIADRLDYYDFWDLDPDTPWSRDEVLEQMRPRRVM